MGCAQSKSAEITERNKSPVEEIIQKEDDPIVVPQNVKIRIENKVDLTINTALPTNNNSTYDMQRGISTRSNNSTSKSNKIEGVEEEKIQTPDSVSRKGLLAKLFSRRGSLGISLEDSKAVSTTNLFASHFGSMPDFRARTSSYVIDKRRNKCESFTPSGEFNLMSTASVDVSSYGSDIVTVLPRGGIAVQTSIGGIQFGAPPETIKDSLMLGIPVPTYYIVYGTMFSRRRGICTAELEFPSYFNYFILKKKITIVTTPEMEKRIRTIFEETLLGPSSYDMSLDFSDKLQDKTNHPDVKKEAEWLDAARKSMNTDSLLTFILFKDPSRASKDSVDEAINSTKTSATMVANITGNNGNSISITYNAFSEMFTIKNTGAENNFNIFEEVQIPKDTLHHFNDQRFDDYNWGIFDENIHDTVRIDTTLTYKKNNSDEKDSPTPLRPILKATPSMLLNNQTLFINHYQVPQFGVTMLGSSHGFDKDGTTTGFILWIRRRGILVDPPPHGIDLLARNGVSHKFIDGIVLTHCHGDHDAGTFRSLFFDRGLTLYTTKTIYDSFQRKYSAVSDFSSELLSTLIKVHFVKIGEPLFINGGVIDFFYSLHTIPCIGIKAKCSGKTFAYSADTHMNPELVERMYVDGAIGKGRRDSLLNFPWDADLILHEAGVAPIHTPISVLEGLDPDIKKRLYLVHVTPSNVPTLSGLKVAKVGQTIRLPDIQENEHQGAIQALNLFKRISLLQPCFKTMDNAMQILQGAKVEEYKEGEVILSKSSQATKFCVIMSGVVSIEIENDKGVSLKKYYTTGDFFGESLVDAKDVKPIAQIEIVAISKVEIVSLDRNLFMDLIRNTNIAQTMQRLSDTRGKESWFAMDACKGIRDMTITEKTHLESLFTSMKYEDNDIVWKCGEDALKCLLIVDGQFAISANRSSEGGAGNEEVELGMLHRGAFVGDINAIMSRNLSQTSLKCAKRGLVLEISQRNLYDFFLLYPGAIVNFKDQQWVN